MPAHTDLNNCPRVHNWASIEGKGSTGSVLLRGAVRAARHLDKIEKTYGKAKTHVGDGSRHSDRRDLAGDAGPGTRDFLSGGNTPKGKIQQYERKRLDLPWQTVRDSVDVKLFEQDGELYMLAKSEGRRAKETAMRRKRLARLFRKLRVMRRGLPSLVQLLMRLDAAKAHAGRAFQFVHLQVSNEGQQVTRETFQFRVDKKKLQEAEWRDGHYLLRSNLTVGDPSKLEITDLVSLGLSKFCLKTRFCSYCALLFHPSRCTQGSRRGRRAFGHNPRIPLPSPLQSECPSGKSELDSDIFSFRYIPGIP